MFPEFDSEHNVRILSVSPPGDDLGSWLGRPPILDTWFTLAIEQLPVSHPDSPSGIVAERGAGPNARRALLSGHWRGFDCALADWERAEAYRRPALAIRAALDGYRAALERPDRPRVVGVVNVTPDSFSDGGLLADADAAVSHGLALVAAGADWLDVGGESTRPGAREVPAEEELRRALPVVSRLAAEAGVPISIDTRKAAVAEACLAAGASIVNDVSGLSHDPEMAAVVARAGAGLVLMHMPGDPATMQQRAVYEDVVADTARWLRNRAAAAADAGIAPRRLWIDPGFGFGKTVAQNLSILRRLREYTSIGLPIMVGTSRKSTLGAVLGGLPPDQRLEATAATVTAAVLNGAAAVRVHDVREMARATKMAWAVARGTAG